MYNWDDNDGTCSNAIGYGEQPPAQGGVSLNAAMTSHRFPTHREGPTCDIEDAMNGTTNGEPFMELGYPTHFQYSGGTFIGTMQLLNDRRSVDAIGPFDFAPSDTLCIDMAFSLPVPRPMVHTPVWKP